MLAEGCCQHPTNCQHLLSTEQQQSAATRRSNYKEKERAFRRLASGLCRLLAHKNARSPVTEVVRGKAPQLLFIANHKVL